MKNKKIYKINNKYTSKFEKLTNDYLVLLYKKAGDNKLKNEIIMFFINKYYILFSKQLKKLYNTKEDIETTLYFLILKAINKYIEFNKYNNSFKNYIYSEVNFYYKTFLTKKRQLNKQIKKWKKIEIITFNNLQKNEKINIFENLSDWYDLEKYIQQKDIIDRIKEKLKKMWKRWEIFYNRVFNWITLEKLSEEYWISKERVRQIEEEVRENIKKIYWDYNKKI